MFKTETHSHTSPASSCSHLTPREMVELYHEAGYTTLFISDHLSNYQFNKYDEQLTFAQKIDLFYQGYLDAKPIGEQYGMHILFSPELGIDGNHFILYNATIEFLKEQEDLFTLSIGEFRRRAEPQGITIIQAHPYRNGKYTPKPEYVDGVEVFNGNPRAENFNEKALELAKQYHLPMTVGSDAHRLEDIGGTAVLTEQPITSADEYLALLKAGKLTLMAHGKIL